MIEGRTSSDIRRSRRFFAGTRAVRWTVVLLLTTLVLTTAASVLMTRRLAERSGLEGRHRALGAGLQAAVAPRLDRSIVTDTLADRARALGATGLDVEWRGHLLVPRTAVYRFAPAVQGELTIAVDGVVASDSARPPAAPALRLSEGLHDITLQFRGEGQMRLDLLWAADAQAFHRLPALYLLPGMPSPGEQRIRILLTQTQLVLPVLWSGVVLVVLGWLAASVARRSGMVDALPAPLRALCLAAAVLFLAGLQWGIPGYGSWAPDELSPGEVLEGAAGHLTGDWATIYPPLHFLLLAVVLMPFRLLEAAGMLPLDTLGATAGMLTVTRVVSLGMAVATVFIVHRIGREMATARAGLLAAAMFGVALPLAFYAKTANLDVPYTFWVAAALLFYARTFRAGEPHDFYGFTAAGIAAICTKDQAYGFFILPALYMAGGAMLPAAVRPRGAPAPAVLLRMAVLGAIVFAVCFNLPLNWTGFVEHLELITGPASQNYRMFEGFTGQGRLALATLVELGRAMSWPVALLSVAAIAVSIAGRSWAIAHFLLPALSYYLTFIAVVGYVYDRFLLGVVLITAVAASVAVDRWLPARGLHGWRSVVVGGALLLALARVVSLDLLMLQDSRYAAERWLRNRHAGERIAAVGQREYLPRPGMIPWTPLRPDLAQLEELRPDVVIVNAAYSQRASAGTPAGDFYEALRSGRAGYRLARRFRTSTSFLPLGLEARFREPREDAFSNLSKVNPPIEIYLPDRE